MKNIEKSIRDKCDKVKKSSFMYLEFQKMKRENGGKIIEDVIAKNFAQLIKDTHRFKNTQGIP